MRRGTTGDGERQRQGIDEARQECEESETVTVAHSGL
jgi:hypothetical protein